MRQLIYRHAEDAFLRINSKTADAFRTISKSFFGLPFPGALKSAYKLIEKNFQLGKREAQCLALLIRGDFPSIPCDIVEYLCRLLNDSKTNVEAYLAVLKKKRIVREDTFDLEFEFKYAVEEDIPYSEAISKIQIRRFCLVVDNCSETVKTMTTDKSDDNPIPGIPEEKQAPRADAPEIMEFQVRTMLRSFPETTFAMGVDRITKGLTAPEKYVLFILMVHFVRNFILPTSITKSLEPYSSEIGTLIKKGLVANVIEDQNDRKVKDLYRISPRCAKVFHGRENTLDFSQLTEYGSFVPSEDIRAKELFFPDEDKEGMELFQLALEAENLDRITEELTQKGLRPCFSVIMSGCPGTGKTELAMQAARRTGRGVFMADASKLYGMWWGESEKNFRGLFQAYRYLCAVSTNVPLLFMDEADGILAKRSEAGTNSTRRSENIIQNIILEETNTLPGIFVATTNLIGSLDEAMLRRFMIRLEFHLPDAETRERLWHARFPYLPEKEIAELATKFAISGGLIDNIASMAIVDGIIRNRAITAKDLAAYCERQGFGCQERRRIGF